MFLALLVGGAGAQAQLKVQAVEPQQDLESFFADQPLIRLELRPGRPLVEPGDEVPEVVVQAVLERAREMAVVLSADDVRAAAVYFRVEDSLDELVEITQKVAQVLLAGCAGGALGNFSLEIGRGIAYNFSNGSHGGEAPSAGLLLRKTAQGCLCGALATVLAGRALATNVGVRVSGTVAASSSTALRVLNTAAAFPIRAACNATINFFVESDIESSPGCELEVDTVESFSKAELHTWAQDCVWPKVNARYGQDLSTLDALLADEPEDGAPILPVGLTVSDSVFYDPVVESGGTVELTYFLLPTATGTTTVDIVVKNEGVESVLQTDTFETLPTDVGTFAERTFTFPAQTLIDLHPGTDTEFHFLLDITHGSFNLRYQGPDGEGALAYIDTSSDFPPSVFLNADAAGRTVTFSGSYFDADDDEPTLLRLEVVGATTQTLNLMGDLGPETPSDSPGFSKVTTLNNGNHTYRLVYSDGVSVRQTNDFSLRVSESAPTVSVMLVKPDALPGETVPGEVFVSDDAGPVPGTEIALATDHQSPFTNSTSETVRKVETDASGHALFSYQPITSGSHTILAMEPGHEYDLTYLDVQGNPSDWTTKWTFSLQTSTETQATYGVQVFIQQNSQNLDPGDYVHFSANHGGFLDEEDQVGVSSIAVNEYSLTKSEAESGDEVFTLDLPKYGVQLTHVTNLPVGSPGSLSPVRTTTLLGQPDEDESYAVAFSRDGRYAAHIRNQNDVEILNLSDLSLVRVVDPGGDDLSCLQFSPDGEHIVTGDNDGNLAVISVATGAWSRRSRTDGHADILNVDWYDSNRIAAATAGGTSTYPYTPRVLILDSLLNLIQAITFPNVVSGEDIFRVRCNASSQLCAMATWVNDTRWFLFSPTGMSISQETHPDNNVYWGLAFNEAGDKLVVGGDDANGATQLLLYSVSSSSKTPLTPPYTTNTDVYAVSFFFEEGQERLAVGGNSQMEVFASDGGAPLRSAPDTGHTTRRSYYLDFIQDRLQLAAINNSQQDFYNFSGDYIGPSILLNDPGAVPFSQTSAVVNGAVSDLSGLESVEYRVGTGSWMSLALGGDGTFSIQLDSLPVGPTVATVRASDVYFNETTSSVTVIRQDDLEAPLISQVSVSPSSVASGELVSIETRVQDLGAGVSSVSAKVHPEGGSTPVSTLPMTFSGEDLYSATLDTSNLPGGHYFVDIEAVDASASGNQSIVTNAAAFGLCEGTAQVVISDQTLTAGTYTACRTLTLRNVSIPGGQSVVLQAGEAVIFESGVVVEESARLSVIVAPLP